MLDKRTDVHLIVRRVGARVPLILFSLHVRRAGLHLQGRALIHQLLVHDLQPEPQSTFSAENARTLYRQRHLTGAEARVEGSGTAH